MKHTALYVSLTGILIALFLCAPLSASAFQGAGRRPLNTGLISKAVNGADEIGLCASHAQQHRPI